MSKHTYKVASDAGAEWVGYQGLEAQVGEEVELELDAEQRNAVIAAGWLEQPERKTKEK